MCASRLQAERREQLAIARANWEEQGGSVGLLTLTLRHGQRHTLKETFGAVAGAWRRMWAGREGRRLRAPIAHSVRAAEVTHGDHGWHPHLHVLVFHSGEVTPEWLSEVQERWAACVAAEQPECIPRTDAVGVRWDGDLHTDYLAKMGLTFELAPAPGAKGRSPWQIGKWASLEAEALKDGEIPTTPWRLLWREYAEATHGRRQLTWSVGAKRALCVPSDRDEPAQVDPEAAAWAEEHGLAWAIVLSPGTWARLVRAVPPAIVMGWLDSSEHAAEELRGWGVELVDHGIGPLDYRGVIGRRMKEREFGNDNEHQATGANNNREPMAQRATLGARSAAAHSGGDPKLPGGALARREPPTATQRAGGAGGSHRRLQ